MVSLLFIFPTSGKPRVDTVKLLAPNHALTSSPVLRSKLHSWWLPGTSGIAVQATACTDFNSHNSHHSHHTHHTILSSLLNFNCFTRTGPSFGISKHSCSCCLNEDRYRHTMPSKIYVRVFYIYRNIYVHVQTCFSSVRLLFDVDLQWGGIL